MYKRQVEMEKKADLMSLVEEIKALDLSAKLCGVIHIINDGLADVVQSDETRVLYGQEYVYEELLGLKFKISVFSFFQTNSLGAEVLYSKAREYIGETKDKLIDVYKRQMLGISSMLNDSISSKTWLIKSSDCIVLLHK